MGLIPLFTEPKGSPDGPWHLAAPGGYEWWYFDAQDAQGELFLTARFHWGYALDEAYAQKYARYIRRPTKHRPPVPAEYPRVELAVYRHGKLAARMDESPAPSQCSLSEAQVRLGASHMRFRADGGFELRVGTAADLVFERVLAGEPAMRPWAGDAHRWLIAAPYCLVGGSVTIKGETFQIAGRGYHDHRLGTRPLATAADHWAFARVLLDDSWAIVMQQTQIAGRKTVELLQIDATGIHPVENAHGQMALLDDDKQIAAGTVRVGDKEGLALSWRGMRPRS